MPLSVSRRQNSRFLAVPGPNRKVSMRSIFMTFPPAGSLRLLAAQRLGGRRRRRFLAIMILLASRAIASVEGGTWTRCVGAGHATKEFSDRSHAYPDPGSGFLHRIRVGDGAA